VTHFAPVKVSVAPTPPVNVLYPSMLSGNEKVSPEPEARVNTSKSIRSIIQFAF